MRRGSHKQRRLNRNDPLVLVRLAAISAPGPHTPLRTRNSASSMIAAVMPPMNSESGFLEACQDTESGDTSAGSPIGFQKSIGARSPGSISARIAASRLPRKGQGKMIGVFTATNTIRGTGGIRVANIRPRAGGDRRSAPSSATKTAGTRLIGTDCAKKVNLTKCRPQHIREVELTMQSPVNNSECGESVG